MHRVIILTALAAVLAGCDGGKPASTGAPAQAGATNAAPRRSAARDTVYTMTQYDTIKAGRDAQEKVRKIGEAHNRDLDAAAGDQQ